jgi:hypothetical protein
VPITELVEPASLSAVRRLLLLLLVVFMAGTAADLMLLDHHEDVWQMVPLAVIALGVAAAAFAAVSGGAAAVSLMRVVMALFIGSGLIGVGLHFAGNSEFQREIDPGLQGWSLFVKAVTAKAPPALAPAAMIQMGLLGLLYTYRHPALRSPLLRDPSFDQE